ncbi:MAG TPA: CRTAC1 family protein, partial [Thermoanaerobaculia bacterium]|nr:CRTAC1 family protein [Thermoanaerobaculia bacterium]
ALVEVALEHGVDFVHDSGAEGAYLMPEIMAGGVAVFDYDGDDHLDLYFVQSGERVPPPGQAARNAPDRLYRNQGDGTFRDATAGSGLGDRGYGMGAAVGDIDNDGDLDLYVSNYGPDSLWRNNGNGTFSEVTGAWGLGDPAWSASAAFCDFDRDGFLDLYVTRYVAFDPGRECAQQGGRRDYCGPTVFPGVHDLLYRNESGRRFADVSVESGIATVEDAGLGVVCEDLDDDGWPDFYVANDADPNNLWINQRDGTFVDDGMLLGAAFNRMGTAEAGMGVVAADVDGDGAVDLLVSNLIEETNTFYRNLGPAGFEDATASAGLGVGSMDLTGFGVAFFDLENDGHLDVAIVNGAVKRRPSPWDPAASGFWSDYAEPNLLFANTGGARFTEVLAAPFTGTAEVSRAIVAADLDGDGDLDLVTTTLDGPARIYRNDGGNAGSWLSMAVVDPRLRRDAIGARVTILAGGRSIVRHASPAGGYLTGSGARIHLGLGSIERVDGFVVRWPGGEEESFAGGPARRTVELRRGEGKPHRSDPATGG